MISIDTQDVYRMIEQGEGEKIDFKHSITSVTKIAKAIVSFANHKGGVLLIGIKDNGKPTKINCTEEAYMIEAAISKCKPEIKHEINTHEIDGKQILSVNVYQGVELPYLCLDENKKWMAYVRSNDSNVLANWVWLQVAKNKSKKENIQLEYVGIDEMVLKSIKQNPGITQRDLSKEIKQNFRKVGNSLVKLVGMGIVKMIFSKTGAFYQLNV